MIHSLGPWKISPVSAKLEPSVIGPIILDADNNSVAISTEEDASLIAAAPDLLYALEVCIYELENCIPTDRRIGAVKIGLSAIAKARGDK